MIFREHRAGPAGKLIRRPASGDSTILIQAKAGLHSVIQKAENPDAWHLGETLSKRHWLPLRTVSKTTAGHKQPDE